MATVELFRERTKLSEQEVVKILVDILEINGRGEEKGYDFMFS